MSEAAILVAIVSSLGWLILNIRALRSHRLPPERMAVYAVAWIVIFAVVAVFAGRFWL